MKTIKLTQGYEAVVDDEDYEMLTSMGSWCYSHGYALKNHSLGGGKIKKVYQHRLILNFPESHVDHIDGNRLNNQRANLRLCTRSENQCNRNLQTNNSTGYKGVSWHKLRNKWRSYIKFDRKCHHLGLFDTALEAALTYDVKAKELHGEFAKLNFPISS